MKFKKIVVVLLALAMILCLAACGKKQETAQNEQPQKQEETKTDDKQEETKTDDTQEQAPAANADPYGLKSTIDAVAASGYTRPDTVELLFAVSWEAADAFQGAYNEWKDNLAAYGINVTMKGPADYTNATEIGIIDDYVKNGKCDAVLYYPVENVANDYKDKAKEWWETYHVPIFLYGEGAEGTVPSVAQYICKANDSENYAATGKVLACGLPFFVGTAQKGELSKGMDFNQAMGGIFEATIADINLFIKNDDPYEVKSAIDMVKASGYTRPDTMNLLFAVSWETADAFVGAYNEWKDNLAAYGINVTMKGPADYTNATEISIIEEALKNGECDAVLYYPVENVANDYKEKAQEWWETYHVPIILYGLGADGTVPSVAQYICKAEDSENYAATGKVLACGLPFFVGTAQTKSEISTGLDFNQAMGGMFEATIADINLYIK